MTKNQAPATEPDPRIQRTSEQLGAIQLLFSDKRAASHLSERLSDPGQSFAAFLVAILTGELGVRIYAPERSFPRYFLGEYHTWKAAIEDLSSLRSDLLRSSHADGQSLAAITEHLIEDEEVIRAQLREQFCIVETVSTIYVFRKERDDKAR